MWHLVRAAAAAALVCTSALASADSPRAESALGGTLVPPAPYAATVVIVPAPTNFAPDYRPLADALQERGFGSLLLDRAAKPDGAAVAASAAGALASTASPCIWLLGHGAGAKVALAAAQRTKGLCGVILVGASARSKSVRLAADLSVPLLIVSPGKDSRASAAEGAALREAQPGARHAVILEMDGALRSAAADGVALLPVSPKLVDVIGSFMLEKGPQVHGSLEPKERGSHGSRRAELGLGLRSARS